MLDRLSATLRFAHAVSATCWLLAAALYRPRIGCAVLAVCRLLAASLYRPRIGCSRQRCIGGAVLAACRLYAKALYRSHQQRRHVGRTELRRVGRTPTRIDNV